MDIEDKDINIRMANIKDATGLANCNKANLPAFYTASEYLNSIKPGDNDNDNSIVVATWRGLIIGYIFGELSRGNIHIVSLAVDKPFRSKGVGSGLMAYLRMVNKFKSMSLFVYTENKPAISFYKKHGFRVVQKLADYYRGTFDANNCDAYKMIYIK